MTSQHFPLSQIVGTQSVVANGIHITSVGQALCQMYLVRVTRTTLTQATSRGEESHSHTHTLTPMLDSFSVTARAMRYGLCVHLYIVPMNSVCSNCAVILYHFAMRDIKKHSAVVNVCVLEFSFYCLQLQLTLIRRLVHSRNKKDKICLAQIPSGIGCDCDFIVIVRAPSNTSSACIRLYPGRRLLLFFFCFVSTVHIEFAKMDNSIMNSRPN